MKKIISLLVFAFAVNAHGKEQSIAGEVSEAYLKEIVEMLSVSIGPRNFEFHSNLVRTSEYIQLKLVQQGYKVFTQDFPVNGKHVNNVLASIGPEGKGTIVVGAHYDTYGDQPGADDNASGVAGLLALAKLLKNNESMLNKKVELVAYTLEEPPFFRTVGMGSYVHAKGLKDRDEDVVGMISLEMIGYFTEEPDSQTYPIGLMKLWYPSEGDFIGVISNYSSSELKSAVSVSMKKSGIKVESLSAPSWLVGVDFSDHKNYWKFGYQAVMVTDTSFYRNENYHQKTDVVDTLNFAQMKKVVEGVYHAVVDLPNSLNANK